jgi:hypothetical protein
MDPAHGTTQDDENILQGMIHENKDIDIDVTRTFLNDSGEGAESLNRGDGSSEVEAEAWDGGEADEEEADEGEADKGESDGSGGTLNLANSGEVYICIIVIKMLLSIYIYMHILTLFLLLALRIEHFFRKNEMRPSKKVGLHCEV